MYPTIIFGLAIASSVVCVFCLIKDLIKEWMSDEGMLIIIAIPTILWSWLFYLLH